ncbi:hypothetical protein [Dyadobacter sp. CY312]|uniref:hypothetical protein n=1 Tax=Dyadobacter sp. CY312 TaxID=2907303 RepID=UPI001F36F1DF|nr:hypothetical protein [Dyadobacter sp. CY312]MCE7043964.1 hypothetical protein [Dyadobacter sp. CY312]
MKNLVTFTAIIAFFVSSCNIKSKEKNIVFDSYIGNSLSIPKDSIILTYRPLNDSVSYVLIKNRRPLHVYESERGLFFASIDNNEYKLALSFEDTLSHYNPGYPFDSLAYTTLVKSKIYLIDDVEIPVYCFNEGIGDEGYNKSHVGSVTYYTPRVGILIYYTGENVNSAYVRRFPRHHLGEKIIAKIKADTTFYAGHLLKNLPVKSIKYLPLDYSSQ